MASSSKQSQLPEYAAAAEPEYTYVPNKGYMNEDEGGQFRDVDEGEQYEEDGGDEDLFDDELNDQDWTDDRRGGDFTKQYNRQRTATEKGTAPGAVKSNIQKPRANLVARVDDQISSLAKFAARIKLGDTEAGMTGGKEDRWVYCFPQPRGWR
jgi:RIO kinase 1